jgi:penicillin-binding protein 1A
MTKTARFIRYARSIFYFALILGGLAAITLIGLFFIVTKDLPRVPDPISRIIETPPTEVFASTGERVMLIGGREAVPLDRVSRHFIEAVIAIEDHRFYDHHGVDKLRTVKALWITLFQPGKIQGASTITQQLAKNLFFSFRRTYIRKFRELLVAFQIESTFSKDEILEAYINQIPFGAREFGVEQAARAYLGKPASELSLAEAALLAGLPKSPTRYNPYRHFERAKKRQKIVLNRMAAVGFITREEAAIAHRAELKLRSFSGRTETGSYFLDMVIKQLEEKYGTEAVYHGGLKVMTTLDLRLQEQANQALRNGLDNLDKNLKPRSNPKANNTLQGALVAIETNTGAVRAVAGGKSYSASEFNRAVKNNRQPGSGFKPFLYYTAFEKLAMSPITVIQDKPVVIKVKGAPDWRPKNFKRKHAGDMTLKLALTKSVNSVAAQIVEKTGPEAVIDTARRCGVESRLQKVYSVALGTSGVSPLEMASAFSTFATGGVHHEPFWIRRVEDFRGRVLEEKIIGGKRRLDRSITYQLLDMMIGVMNRGTGAVTRRLGFKLPAAGKTGTSNDYRDAWFTGFTPNLCASVWVGFDQNTPMRDKKNVGITGGRGAAPIWTQFMLKATAGEPPRDFSVPADIRFEHVDALTGKAEPKPENKLRVALRAGQEVPRDIFKDPYLEEETPLGIDFEPDGISTSDL